MQSKKERAKQFITSQGVGLSYDLKGQGLPLVFIHGWSGSSQDFSGTARRLSKKYTTLIYDQRGHGRSDGPLKGYSLSHLAQDLYELIRHLGLKKVILVGHSMGGAVVLAYLRAFSHEGVEGIILVDMAPKLVSDETWHLGLYKGGYKEEDFKKDILQMKEDFDFFYFGFLKRMLPGFTEEKIKKRICLKKKLEPLPYLPGLIELWEDMALMDYRQDLKGILFPVGIFIGEFSIYSKDSALYLTNNLVRGSMVEFKGCTHQLILENPRGFEREIQHFIEKEGLGRNNG